MRHVPAGFRARGWVVAAVLGGAFAAVPAAAAPDGQVTRRANIPSDVDAYVLSVGHESMSSNVLPDDSQALRARLSGDFLWFRRGGRAYVIDDAEALKQAQTFFAPLRELEGERRDLNRRLQTLSEQEEALDRQQDVLDRRLERLTDGEAGGDTEGDDDPEFMVMENDDAAPPTDEEKAEMERELERLRDQQDALQPRERDLEAQDRALDAEERALDAREQRLEAAGEEKLWRLADDAIKTGAARKF